MNNQVVLRAKYADIDKFIYEKLKNNELTTAYILVVHSWSEASVSVLLKSRNF